MTYIVIVKIGDGAYLRESFSQQAPAIDYARTSMRDHDGQWAHVTSDEGDIFFAIDSDGTEHDYR